MTFYRILSVLFGCLAVCSPLASAEGGSEGHGGDVYGMEFVQYGKDLVSAAAKSDLSAFPAFSSVKFANAVATTTVYSQNQVTIPDPLTQQPTEVDAANYPDKSEIILSRSRWVALGQSDDVIRLKASLALHEYIWMSGTDDTNYVVSGPLAPVLMKSFVAHPTIIPADICRHVQPTPVDTFASVADLSAKLSNIWISCGQPGFLWEQDAIGVSFGPNLQWQVLKEQFDGEVTLASGFEEQGQIQIIDDSAGSGPGTYQVNIVDSMGMGIENASFSADGRTLAFSDTSGFPWIFQALSSGDDRLGDAGCSMEESIIHSDFSTPSDLISKMTGRWVICGSSSWGSDVRGIEFTPAGTWTYLNQGPTGDYVPSSDPSESGTYSVSITPDVAPISFFYASGGMNPASIAISDIPAKMELGIFDQNPVILSALPNP